MQHRAHEVGCEDDEKIPAVIARRAGDAADAEGAGPEPALYWAGAGAQRRQPEPRFIPVLGYLDDVLLLPALIWLAARLLPAPVLAGCRRQADDWMQAQGRKPRSPFGIVLVVCVWLACGLAVWMVWKR